MNGNFPGSWGQQLVPFPEGNVLSSVYLALRRPDLPKRRPIYFNGIHQPSCLPCSVNPHHKPMVPEY